MKRLLFFVLFLAGTVLANESNDVRFAKYRVDCNAMINGSVISTNTHEVFIIIPKVVANSFVSESMISATKQMIPNWTEPEGGLTIRQFVLFAEDLDESSTLIQIAVNYAGNSGRVSYGLIDSDDVALFMYFANQFGMDDSDLMTSAEKTAFMKELR
jgi:hypothetical protein